MTGTNAAGRVEMAQNWTKALRITEAEVALPSRPQGRWDSPLIDGLHQGMARLHTAWRWLEVKRSQQIASKRLRVAETISLGDKRTISIVSVDGAQYLIGSSSGGVQLLTKLDPTTEQASRTEVLR